MATLPTRKRALAPVCLTVTVSLIFYFTFFRASLPGAHLSLPRKPLKPTSTGGGASSSAHRTDQQHVKWPNKSPARSTRAVQAQSSEKASTTANVPPSTSSPQHASPLEAVSNATLGFEKIIAINLPERTDRRDVLTLMSSINGIKLDWQDAVKGTDLVEAARPAHWNTGDNKALKAGELGNWRSHISALRRVVEEGYTSALIIEDDADWDVALKSQLRAFAEKTRAIGNVPFDKRTPSPYGDQWDILWIGNCATPAGPEDSQRFPGVGDQEHWVFQAHDGLSCLYGYAVTQWAAEMLMGWLLDVKVPTDFAISAFCEHHKCITVWPELIGSHKSAGANVRDSNISNHTGNGREEGTTRNIVNSAILDMLSRMGH